MGNEDNGDLGDELNKGDMGEIGRGNDGGSLF